MVIIDNQLLRERVSKEEESACVCHSMSPRGARLDRSAVVGGDGRTTQALDERERERRTKEKYQVQESRSRRRTFVSLYLIVIDCCRSRLCSNASDGVWVFVLFSDDNDDNKETNERERERKKNKVQQDRQMKCSFYFEEIC